MPFLVVYAHMLMIRFQRIGRTNDPAFRIVLTEKERAAKAGAIVERLGTYNPKTKAFTLEEERVKYWISKGAQPTDSIHNLFINKGVIVGKKINVLPKKTVSAAPESATVSATTATSEPTAAPVVETPAASAATETEPQPEEVLEATPVA